jgi:hypothetical protein
LGCNFPVLVDPTRRIKTINGDANYWKTYSRK